MTPNLNNTSYDTMTHRIFVSTLERLCAREDTTSERCYITSNEYLSEYMQTMDLKGKKIATVGTSGDQFFNALLQGSKDITIIDANPYAQIFVEYKRAILQHFDFEQAIDVLKSSKMFNWKTYSQISYLLSNKSKQFWDTLMLESEAYVDEYVERFDQSVIGLQLTHGSATFLSDFYKDEETFYRLQKLLRNKNYRLRFLTADLCDFPKVLNEQYDVIMLSNILCYNDQGEARVNFEKAVGELYDKILSPGGTIQVQYSYRQHWSSVDPHKIANLPLRIQEISNGHRPKTIYYIDKPLQQAINF